MVTSPLIGAHGSRRLIGPLVACVLAVASTCAAQTPTIFYFYDELDRLSRVVDQQGNVATYTYDAVGNLLRIERVDTSAIPGPVGITLVTPDRGPADTTVRILGKGFSTTPGQNAVAFNGTAAMVTEATPIWLVTKVPSGATSGPITVTTALGSATSPASFRITGLIAITPPGDVVPAGSARQFAASDPANPGSSFAWSVNGTVGGNPVVGTITPTGLYTAPASVPASPAVTLTATEVGDIADSASAPVLVVAAPLPATLAARSVSAQVQAPTASSLPTISSAAPVSVEVEPSSASSATGVATPVGVRIETPPAPMPATPGAAGVAVSFRPFITAVSPASVAAETANVTVTLTGSGFTGATDVTLLRNNVADPAIAVSNLAVNDNGTRATVTISVAAGAPAGGRVVRIATPGGSSTPAGLVGNILTVQ